MANDRRSADKTHLDKTIPIWQILGTVIPLMAVIAAPIYYQVNRDGEQDNRISVNTAGILSNKESNEKYQRMVEQQLTEINNQLKRSDDRQEKFFNVFLDMAKKK